TRNKAHEVDNFGKHLLQCRAHGVHAKCHVLGRGAGEGLHLVQTVDVVRFFMQVVESQLVMGVGVHEQAGGQTDGQAQYVDQADDAVALDVIGGGFEVVEQHIPVLFFV